MADKKFKFLTPRPYSRLRGKVFVATGRKDKDTVVEKAVLTGGEVIVTGKVLTAHYGRRPNAWVVLFKEAKSSERYVLEVTYKHDSSRTTERSEPFEWHNTGEAMKLVTTTITLPANNGDIITADRDSFVAMGGYSGTAIPTRADMEGVSHDYMAEVCDAGDNEWYALFEPLASDVYDLTVSGGTGTPYMRTGLVV